MKAAVRNLIRAIFALAVLGLAAPVQASGGGPTIYLPLVSAGSPIQSALPPSASLGWLDYLNAYRAQSGLQPLAENPDWSAGEQDHAKYTVETGTLTHKELQGPYSSVPGNTEAGYSNIMASSTPTTSDIDALDMWLEGPFHALGILDPRLSQTGFGSYRDANSGTQFKMAAGIDVLQQILQGTASLPAGFHYPVMWPGNGATIGLTSYTGGEWPDPLAPCNSYTAPSGLPIILQLGDGSFTTQFKVGAIYQGSTQLPSCAYDSSNSTWDNNNTAQWILGGHDAIVLIPRDPLTPGSTYTVSITGDNTVYTWSFAVGK